VFQSALVFESHGAILGLQADDPAIIEVMKNRLPPAARLLNGVSPFSLFTVKTKKKWWGFAKTQIYSVYADQLLVARTENLADALNELESQFHFDVALRALPFLFVHAGVVGWKGGAIVLPGRSGSGKSTLVTELLAAGAEYYSDEYAVFDSEGRVYPYPKSLSLREPWASRYGTGKPTAVELGARVGELPVPVRLVAATRYEADAEWRPEALSGGQTMLRLLDNTITARSRTREAMAIFMRVADGSLGLQGARPSAERIVTGLLKLSESRNTSSVLSLKFFYKIERRNPGSGQRFCAR